MTSKKILYVHWMILVGWLWFLRHIQPYFSYIVTGQLSSFQILTCYRAPTPWAARGLKRAEPTPTWAPGRPKTSFTSLPSEGPHAVRVSRDSNPDRPIQSPARYLCATAAGWMILQFSPDLSPPFITPNSHITRIS